MTTDLTDVLAELHEIGDLLGHAVWLTARADVDDQRRLIAELTAIADAAAFAALEGGDLRDTHHAFACAKELGVLSMILDHARDRTSTDD